MDNDRIFFIAENRIDYSEFPIGDKNEGNTVFIDTKNTDQNIFSENIYFTTTDIFLNQVLLLIAMRNQKKKLA